MTHRPRVSNLSESDPDHPSHKRWETVSAFSYVLGGLTFIAGSICFFPALSAWLAVGDWLFFAGSLLYLLVTGHDLLEVIKYWRHNDTDNFADHIEFIAAWSYVVGTLFFLLGSLCFLPSLDWTFYGTWCFILGSLLFVIGGFVNILQVVEAPSLLYMQLFNLTVGTFVVGSALFVVASVPYLWNVASGDKPLLFQFVAWQYTVGSLLFFVGGVLTYYRKLVRDQLESFCRLHRLGTIFISSLRQEIHNKSRIGQASTWDADNE
ncbi:MAG: YrhK family protein [Salinisphaera sp.]|nr:YrhK family protein [Salinisphaera sp.]